MIKERERHFMDLAIEESRHGMVAGNGGPFGCIIVKGEEIMGRGHNRVLSSNDPTAHAEVVAIRDACARMETFQLEGCEIYCSCEPCPMCFGAIYWARPDKVYFANTKEDAASIGFDDKFIYEQLEIPLGSRKIPLIQIVVKEAFEVFEEWKNKQLKKLY